MCYADLEGWGKRVIFASIHFINKKIMNWKLTEFSGQNSSIPSEIPVDSGLACFIDASFQSLFTDEIRDFKSKYPEGNFYGDVLDKEFNIEEMWAKHKLSNGENMYIFWTGLGDGYYKSYWGLNNNEIVRFVVNFDVFGEGC